MAEHDRWMPCCIVVIWVASASIFQVPTAFGHDIFSYQGPAYRASGGAGQLFSRSGAAILHNPALQVKSPGDVTFDLGLSNWSYRFDPLDDSLSAGDIKLPVVPLVSLGAIYKPQRPFALGVIFIPLGLAGAKQDVNQFPFRSNGIKTMVDAEAESRSYKAGLGFAYSFGRKLQVGVGVVHHSFDQTLTLLSESTGEPVIDIRNRYQVQTYRLGFSGHFSRGVWGFSYQPAVSAEDKLTSTLASGESGEGTGTQYLPQKAAFGLAINLPKGYTVYFNYLREWWIKGTYEHSDPLDRAVAETDVPTDFLDTNNLVLGLRARVSKGSFLFTSFSSFSGNKGPGVLDADGNTSFSGIGAQDFEALNRRHFNLGYQGRLWQKTFWAYLTYIHGTASAPLDTPGQGDYELKIVLVGSGMRL